jgi:hypothetical protein
MFYIDNQDKLIIKRLIKDRLEAKDEGTWSLPTNRLDLTNNKIIGPIEEGLARISADSLTPKQKEELGRILELLASWSLNARLSLSDPDGRTTVLSNFWETTKQTFGIR